VANHDLREAERVLEENPDLTRLTIADTAPDHSLEARAG
jgi:hypothetical protein